MAILDGNSWEIAKLPYRLPSSRMLANIWLKLHGHQITEWPSATDGTGTESVIRAEYLAAIGEAVNGKIAALLAIHERYTSSP